MDKLGNNRLCLQPVIARFRRATHGCREDATVLQPLLARLKRTMTAEMAEREKTEIPENIPLTCLSICSNFVLTLPTKGS
jgi:hypothetical protein